MLMDPGYPLLLAPTRAGWQRSPLSAGQAGMWLRGNGFGREPRFFEEDWYPLMQGDVPELVCQKQ